MKAMPIFIALVACCLLAPITAFAQCVPDVPTGCGIHGITPPTTGTSTTVSAPATGLSLASLVGSVGSFGLGNPSWLATTTLATYGRLTVVGAQQRAVEPRRRSTDAGRR